MASVSEQTTQVQAMVEGSPSADAVELAIDDAETFVKCYGGAYIGDLYSLLVRYYAAHLLVMQGHAKILLSKSVGDVSESRQAINQGDKEGSTPYLIEFNKLLKGDELFVSI